MAISGIHLDETRAVLAVSGETARAFLQGLVSNDMAKVAPGRGIFAALLTPQGKLITDFFVTEHDGAFLIDVAAARAADLEKRLTLYRLRAKIGLADLSATHAVACLMGAVPDGAAQLASFADPRDAALGFRVIGPRPELAALAATKPMEASVIERLRIARHVPSSRELEPDKFFLLDINFEEANGVDFRKGCYVGQEVTARMKHRASARKRLLTVHLDTAAAPNTPILAGELAIGELRSSMKDGDRFIGLAHLRIDRLSEAQSESLPLTCGGNRIEVAQDDWWRSLV